MKGESEIGSRACLKLVILKNSNLGVPAEDAPGSATVCIARCCESGAKTTQNPSMSNACTNVSEAGESGDVNLYRNTVRASGLETASQCVSCESDIFVFARISIGRSSCETLRTVSNERTPSEAIYRKVVSLYYFGMLPSKSSVEVAEAV